MKYLYLVVLSTILVFSLALSSCQKSSDNSKPSSNNSKYKPLTDSLYVVKNGTITFNQNGKTTNYIAPEDLIYVQVRATGFEVHANKAFVSDALDFSFTQDENNKILEHFASSHEFSADDAFFSNGNTSSINVKEFNNISDGVLMNADFTCSYYNPFTNAGTVSASGTINLMFTKKL